MQAVGQANMSPDQLRALGNPGNRIMEDIGKQLLERWSPRVDKYQFATEMVDVWEHSGVRQLQAELAKAGMGTQKTNFFAGLSLAESPAFAEAMKSSLASDAYKRIADIIDPKLTTVDFSDLFDFTPDWSSVDPELLEIGEWLDNEADIEGIAEENEAAIGQLREFMGWIRAHRPNLTADQYDKVFGAIIAAILLVSPNSEWATWIDQGSAIFFGLYCLKSTKGNQGGAVE